MEHRSYNKVFKNSYEILSIFEIVIMSYKLLFLLFIKQPIKYVRSLSLRCLTVNNDTRLVLMGQGKISIFDSNVLGDVTSGLKFSAKPLSNLWLLKLGELC